MSVEKHLFKSEDSENPMKFCEVDGFFLTESYLEAKVLLDDWEVYDEDVWISGSPKTGTTWVQEMAWLIVNDLDYKGAKTNFEERTPYWESTALGDMRPLAQEKNVDIPDFRGDTLKFIQETKVKGKPMCIKTHVPFNLLPKQIKSGTKKPKIIFIARDPKDCVVSLYYFAQNLFGYQGTFKELANEYLSGQAIYGPIWDHTISYWKEKHRSNLLIITYEEMVKDLPSVIIRVSGFLEKRLTNEQMKKLADHLSFESMKQNPAVNNIEQFILNRKLGLNNYTSGDFIRTGKVGSYKQELSPELVKKFDELGTKKTKESGWNFVTQR